MFQTIFAPALPAQIDKLGRLTGAPAPELRQFMQLSTTIDVAAGAVLMHEGAIGAEVMVLLDGELVVERDGQEIATVRVGDVVGELALLNNEPRRATVRATVDSSVAVLSRSEFASVLDGCPVLGRMFLTAAIERLNA
jgi:CRP-like cAMP-binding protein